MLAPLPRVHGLGWGHVLGQHVIEHLINLLKKAVVVLDRRGRHEVLLVGLRATSVGLTRFGSSTTLDIS
jgi:hypothetical protein